MHLKILKIYVKICHNKKYIKITFVYHTLYRSHISLLSNFFIKNKSYPFTHKNYLKNILPVISVFNKINSVILVLTK